MDIKVDLNEIIKYRRDLHQIPEVAYNEFETTKYLLAAISDIGDFEILKFRESGFIALLKGSSDNKTVALRSDIDGLKVKELNDVDYKSKNDNYMHACGHDAHMAMMLAAMKYLYGIKDELAGNIKFIFQHAEEVAPGGAIEFVESSLLDDVDMIFGVHVMPKAKSKSVYVTSGIATSAMDTFEIKVIGKGGHGSTPELAIDPITISSEIISNINNIKARNLGLLDKAVISVCSINSSDSFNVIPNEVTLKGNIRTVDSNLSIKIKDRINSISKNIVKAYDAKAEIIWHGHVRAVNNDEIASKIIKDAALSFLDEDSVNKQDFITSSEDFSSYQSKIPGVLWRLGVGNDHDLHSPHFQIDESALEVGTIMHIKSALLALKV